MGDICSMCEHDSKNTVDPPCVTCDRGFSNFKLCIQPQLASAHREGWEQCKREATTIMMHRHNCLFKADGSTKHTLDVIDSCVDALSAMTYKEPEND